MLTQRQISMYTQDSKYLQAIYIETNVCRSTALVPRPFFQLLESIGIQGKYSKRAKQKYTERERERERWKYIYIYIYVYTYVGIYIYRYI